MACVEDCDQILIAANAKEEEEGWEENGEEMVEEVGDKNFVAVSDSFQNEVDDSMDGAWEAENLLGKEKEWESWEEASITQSQSDCTSIPENVFDIMREGWVVKTTADIVNNNTVHQDPVPGGGVYKQVWSGVQPGPER